MFDNQKKSKSLTPIVVSNLSLLFGKTKILDKIKCKIHNESIVAVLGPNGAGKSMFLKIINGLINKALARDNLCCSPPDNNLAGLSLKVSKPTLCKSLIISRLDNLFFFSKTNCIFSKTDLLKSVGF